MVNPVTSLLSLLQPSQDFYIITIHPSVSQLSDFGTVSSPFLCPSMGPENFSFPLSVFLGKEPFLLCRHILYSLKEGEVSQSCPTLCDTMDCNLLGFSIHGILQARILEWIAISGPP